MDCEIKKLGDVLDYEQPTKYIVDSTDYNDVFKTPVLTAGKSFILGYTDEKVGIFENVPAIIFDDFTTAFHYVDFPFKVKSSAMKILKCDDAKDDLKFLYYQMTILRIDTQLHKRYWISKFSKIKFSRPPLKTQQRIAGILDNAAALRDKTAQLLTEYDLLAQSIFLEMFDNEEEVTIEKLLKNKTLILHKDGNHGGNYPRKEEFGKEGIPFLSAKHIDDNGQFNYKNVEFLNVAKAKTLTIGWLQKDDVLLSHNASVGKVTKYDGFFKEALIGTSLTCYRPDKSILSPFYLQYHLMSPFFYRQLEKIMSQSTRNQVPITAQRKLKLKIPPIELQNEFADKIALIEQQKSLAKQELQESEDLFNCLLQQAFKGEL